MADKDWDPIGRWPRLNPFISCMLLLVGMFVVCGVEPSDLTASLESVEFAGLSISMPEIESAPPDLLCLRWRFEDDMPVIDRGRDEAPGPGVDFGGAAAMGTTPFPPTALDVEVPPPWKLVGVLPAVLPPEADPLTGLSPSLVLPLVAAGGVVTCVVVLLLFAADDDMARDEFLRDAAAELAPDVPAAFFLDLVLVPPTGRLAPEPRLRFLITSVFKLSGRTTPCSFKNKPQALHKG
jgi:hypothetical protein